MKVAIVCTRRKVRWYRTLRAIKEAGFGITEIITWPRPKMIDNLRHYANPRGVPIRVFRANWAANKADAIDIRDRKMVQYVDCVIAIWDYRSHDIRRFLAKALAANKPVYVFVIKG